jgi:hypothetical protein
MALARNKKVDPEAIKAFGSAADARPEPARPTEPAREAVAAPAQAQDASESTSVKARPRKAAGESVRNSGPTSSLVRWSDDELRELRDQLMAYSKRERYSMQEVMTRAMRLGFEQLSADSN